MRKVLCVVLLSLVVSALDWRRRALPSGGGLRVPRGGAAAKEKVNATKVALDMAAVLSVVPVFALTDEKGRPVLVLSNETTKKNEPKPLQMWFTEINVARLHANEIAKLDEKIQLRIAMSNLDQVRTTGNTTTDREVRVCADPREVHVARQLLLRAAGYVNSNDESEKSEGDDASDTSGAAAASAATAGKLAIDFSNETVVTTAATSLQAAIGVDFERDVPLFTLASLNATIGGDRRVVQPWFMSFADLVRAYVNSTVPPEASDDEYKAQAQKALENVLKVGQTAVTTLDKICKSIEKGNDSVFIMPPASSVDAIRKARVEQQQRSLVDDDDLDVLAPARAAAGALPKSNAIFDDDDDDDNNPFAS